MRVLNVLLLCLGLLVAVQAQAEDTPSPSDGLLSIEGLFDEMLEPEEPSVANSGHHSHHKHHWGHSHHHDNHEYWHGRHSAKEEFLHCAKAAVRMWDANTPSTYVPAGEALAACIAANLHRCHDAPGLDVDFTKTVPYNLFINGLTALAAQGPNGLLHATTVFNFYLAGSNQEGSCANRLYELLSKGCHSGSRNAPANLARVLVSLVTASLFQKSQSQFSLQCAGDIPAIILAVSSTYCPSTGLYNPLTMVATTCSPATGPDYEDGPGALLAGSFISLLLLSNKQQTFQLGYTISFVATRYALATTQTTSYTECMGNTDNGLQLRLSGGSKVIPAFSGPLGGADVASGNYGPQVDANAFPLSPDGRRVLCASIAMLAGPSTWDASPAEAFLLWQGVANINIAVAKQVTASFNNGGIKPEQAGGLCVLAKAVYSFTTAKYTTAFGGQPDTWVTITSKLPVLSSEKDLKCLTVAYSSCGASLPNWLSRDVDLASGHDLTGNNLGLFCKP